MKIKQKQINNYTLNILENSQNDQIARTIPKTKRKLKIKRLDD